MDIPDTYSSLRDALLKGGREIRPAQIEMAIQVARVIEEGGIGILQAPTGTGKTGGYLVPLVRSGLVRSGQTAIISTANRTLQNQIFSKDVPFLQKHLYPFNAAMMMGVGNYLCIDRLSDTSKDWRIVRLYPQLERLSDLVDDASFSGDLETLGFPLPIDLRNRINGDRDQCAWSKCDFFKKCYIRKMREAAEGAQILIVNHTLLLLDAAANGAILPARDVLVIDEAHHLADEATSAFTTSVRPTQLSSLLALQVVKKNASARLYHEIEQQATKLWSRVERVPFGKASKIPFRESMPEAVVLVEKLSDLAVEVRHARPLVQTEKETVLFDKLLTRIENQANALQLVFAIADSDGSVHYVERVASRGSVKFQACAAPLDVGPFLRERIFDKTPCTIMTSATLAIGSQRSTERGDFAYFRKRVGLTGKSGVIERVLPPTFDYQNRSLLYIPPDVPEPIYGTGPAVSRYIQAIADEMQKLVLASRGRAFLLFSSNHMLDEVYRRISPALAFPLLRQGDEMSRRDLIDRFRAEEGSVLFGLKSFWEGVDIAGDALSLVVIDKLPFGVPDDPVHAARVNQMKANREDWFGSYVLPEVILQLLQGVGRLLRTPEDRGVMAILDTRLVKKGYGKLVLGALPPARRTMNIADVERFFSSPL